MNEQRNKRAREMNRHISHAHRKRSAKPFQNRIRNYGGEAKCESERKRFVYFSFNRIMKLGVYCKLFTLIPKGKSFYSQFKYLTGINKVLLVKKSMSVC